MVSGLAGFYGQLGTGNTTTLVAENDHVSQIETEVQKLLDDRHLKDAQIGVAVMDTVTGHLLAAANEHSGGGGSTTCPRAEQKAPAAGLEILIGHCSSPREQGQPLNQEAKSKAWRSIAVNTRRRRPAGR